MTVLALSMTCPLPLYAQEVFSLKEIILRVEAKVDRIDGKIDAKYQEVVEKVNQNDQRLDRLEYLVYIIGGIAIFMSPYIRDLLAFFFKSRNNNRIPADKVDWTRPKDGDKK